MRLFYVQVVLPALQDGGLDPLDPWAGGAPIVSAQQIDDPVVRLDALRAANSTVGAQNVALLRQAVGVFAVLDGTDVDSGTAAEIGWAAHAGLPIVGWRSDFRLAGDNEGAIVNLQVEYFIRESGGSIEADLSVAIEHLRQLIG